MPGRAIAALKRIILDERFLDWIKLAVLGQAFDGGDLPPVGLDGEVQARLYHFAIEQYRTCAALADDAADMSAGKPNGLAQEMREQNARLDLFFVEPAVDSDTYGLFHKAENICRDSVNQAGAKCSGAERFAAKAMRSSNVNPLS